MEDNEGSDEGMISPLSSSGETPLIKSEDADWKDDLDLEGNDMNSSQVLKCSSSFSLCSPLGCYCCSRFYIQVLFTYILTQRKEMVMRPSCLKRMLFR